MSNTTATAVALVRIQTDLCVSIGVLMKEGELFEPLYSLTRSAIEFGARAFWLLDVDATLRQRCARDNLMDLTSMYHLRDAARHRPDVAERESDISAAKTNFKLVKGSIAKLFTDVELADDPANGASRASETRAGPTPQNAGSPEPGRTQRAVASTNCSRCAHTLKGSSRSQDSASGPTGQRPAPPAPPNSRAWRPLPCVTVARRDGPEPGPESTCRSHVAANEIIDDSTTVFDDDQATRLNPTLDFDQMNGSARYARHNGLTYYWGRAGPDDGTPAAGGAWVGWRTPRTGWHSCPVTLPLHERGYVHTPAVATTIGSEAVTVQICLWRDEPRRENCTPEISTGG